MWRTVFCLVSVVGLVAVASSCDEDAADCDGCRIEGVCYADLDANPATPCQVCDVSVSDSAWTDNDGATCDDGLYCNGDDSCLSGACTEHGSDPCASIGLCDEDADNCDGVCDGCLFGSTCYADGETNPTEICEICDASASGTSWTDNDGVSCDDDRFCNGADTCSGGSCSVHVGDPCVAPEMCNESNDDCDASCNGCVIDTVCFGDTTPNPANLCEICDVSSSVTQWTHNDGVSCEDGDFCTGIDTCAGGLCEHTGDPCDASETCDSTSASCVLDYGSCIDPIVVTGDATLFGASFTTAFADDQDLQHASCNGGSGIPQAGSAEAVFQVTLGPSETVNVREEGALDTLIMIVSGCDNTVSCLQADDINEDVSYTASVSATEIVHVIVSAMVAAPASTDYQIIFHFP